MEIEARGDGWFDDLKIGRNIEIPRREQAVVANMKQFASASAADSSCKLSSY